MKTTKNLNHFTLKKIYSPHSYSTSKGAQNNANKANNLNSANLSQKSIKYADSDSRRQLTTLNTQANSNPNMLNTDYSIDKDKYTETIQTLPNNDSSSILNKSNNRSINRSANRSQKSIKTDNSLRNNDLMSKNQKYYSTFGKKSQSSSNMNKSYNKSRPTTVRGTSKSQMSINQSVKEQQSQYNKENYTDHVSTLNGLIMNIREKGFEKINNELHNNGNFKNNLASTVDNMQKHLNNLNSEIRAVNKNIEADTQENNKLLYLEERVNREISYMSVEIPAIKSETEQLEHELVTRLDSTRVMRTDYVETESDVNEIKEKIKKTNKYLTDATREKDNIKSGIILLGKHIKLLKEKINKKDRESKSFINDVSSFLNNSVEDFNKSSMR